MSIEYRRVRYGIDDLPRNAINVGTFGQNAFESFSFGAARNSRGYLLLDLGISCGLFSMASAKPRVLYWFRTDLRLHDSPALKAALDLKPECLYPIWCWDPHYVYRARVGPNRWQYLYAFPIAGS